MIKGKMVNWLCSLLNNNLHVAHVESTPAENLLWEVWGWRNAATEMVPMLSHGKGNASLIISTGRKILHVSHHPSAGDLYWFAVECAGPGNSSRRLNTTVLITIFGVQYSWFFSQGWTMQNCTLTTSWCYIECNCVEIRNENIFGIKHLQSGKYEAALLCI